MKDWRVARSHRISAIMFAISGVVFFLTALLGDSGADAAFFVLAMVFVVQALNAWQTSRTTSDGSNRQRNQTETTTIDRLDTEP